VDLDLPIIQSSFLGIRALPTAPWRALYNRENRIRGPWPAVPTRLQQGHGRGEELGAASGLLGNVLSSIGASNTDTLPEFQARFFDGTYDRMRGQYAAQYLGYSPIPRPTPTPRT